MSNEKNDHRLQAIIADAQIDHPRALIPFSQAS